MSEFQNNNYKIINCDFNSLYTNMIDFTQDKKLMKELERIKLRHIRKQKLNEINGIK